MFKRQEGGAAAKKVKTEDDPTKIDWKQALAQDQVRRIFVTDWNNIGQMHAR